MMTLGLMEQNYYYNKRLKVFASALRTASTKAEVRLWCEVLSKGKTGYSFLRQRSEGPYIADLMCKELKLIIEVDGYSHNVKTEEDIERDTVLAALGFTTLRFTDEEVIKDLPNVERAIAPWIADMQVSSSPCPLQRGTSFTRSRVFLNALV